MSGPWERYQTQATQRPSGPWERYAAPAPQPEPEPTRRGPFRGADMERWAAGEPVVSAEDLNIGPRLPENLRGPVGAMNRGISTVLGGVVDLANLPFQAAGVGSDRPVGGSRMLADAMESAGGAVMPEGQQPEGYAERIGEGIGFGAGALLPMGAVASRLSTMGGMAGNVGREFMRPFQAQPVRSLGMETAAGAGAGAGGLAAERMAGDESAQPAARMTGELLGGLAGAMGPGVGMRAASEFLENTPVAGTMIRGMRGAVTPFTQEGSWVRASDRLRSATADPDVAAARIDEPSIGDLSPAQRSGDEGLMGLERAAADTDPVFAQELHNRRVASTERLRQAFTEPAGEATGADARQFLQRQFDGQIAAMEARAVEAQNIANERIQRLAPGMRETEASVIVREEIERARNEMRAQVEQLWGRVPNDTMVPTSQARAAYEDWWGRLSSAQKDAMPPKARAALARADNVDDVPGGPAQFGDSETVHEMRGLYSEMRETSRRAKAAGERTTARIADEIADAILDDLGARGDVDDVGRAINAARRVTAEMHDIFSRGTMGRVLSRARGGGDAVAPERTLDTALGASGARGAVQADELQRAIRGSANADSASQDYLRRRFVEASTSQGELSPERAARFLRDNAEMLDRWPALKRQMQQAATSREEAQRIARGTGTEVKALRQGEVAAVLSQQYGDEISGVFKAQNPAAAARAVLAEARRDPAGKAVDGLKASLLDNVMDRASGASMQDVNTPGRNFLSGQKMAELRSDRQVGPVLEAMLSPAELRRYDAIARELARVERSATVPAAAGGVMDDLPNQMIGLLGRIIAARSGSRVGAGTSGAQLVLAGAFSKRMTGLLTRLTNDQAEALIRQSLRDPELFRDLLTNINRPRNRRRVEKRISEWLASEAGQLAGAAEREIEAPEPLRVNFPWSDD